MKDFKQFSQNWDGIIRNNTLSEAVIQGPTAKGWRPHRNFAYPNGYRIHLLLGMKQEADVFMIYSTVVPDSTKNGKFRYRVEVAHEIEDDRPEFEFAKDGVMPSLPDAIKESEKLIQSAVDKFLKQHGPAKKGDLSGLIGFDQKGLNQIKNWKSQKSSN